MFHPNQFFKNENDQLSSLKTTITRQVTIQINLIENKQSDKRCSALKTHCCLPR